MSGYRNSKEKKSKAHGSVSRSLLKNPWIFAGGILGLDIAMLAAGLALSGVHPQITYTLTESTVEHSRTLSFFGVIAAAVIGIICLLTAFIIAGAFLKKRRAAQLTGAAALLVLSAAMVGASAVMALGVPVKNRSFTSYSDEELRLIIEEEQPYAGTGTVYFFMTDVSGSGNVKLLASTDLSEYSSSDERYDISWVADDTLMIGFEDGSSYRTLQISVDRSEFEQET